MNEIKIKRKKLGLTIRELSEKSNIATGYLSELENGKKQNPSKDTMQNIAKALNCSVQALFFPNENTKLEG